MGGKSDQNYEIQLAGNPSSCVLWIQKQKFRTLVDTGAEVSLISKKCFQNLPIKARVISEKPNLRAVNGQSLKVIGAVNIKFTMNKLTMNHKFYVTDGLNRNFILGRDWLRQNGVRLYFDLGYLRIGKHKINRIMIQKTKK